MPRIHEASRLHDLADLHAMIDVSDGLAADVWHICTESQVGAVLRSDAIPVTDAARNIDDGRPPLEHALGDGEDFELVFALAAEDGRQLIETQPVGGVTLTAIGECVESGLWLETGGVRCPLEPRGYVHAMS
jgi:thiamine-monophosphate kinase